MKDCRVRFDSQTDVAAVVYRAGDQPDDVMRDFAEELRRSGVRTVGVVQTGRSCRAEHPRLSAMMLPTAQVIGLASEGQLSCTGCRLDPAKLAQVGELLACAITHGADLVIVSRFGPLEAAGGGLTTLMARAIDADIPVLIAVPERRFADWVRFSGGMHVRLACCGEALRHWWNSTAGTAHPPRPTARQTFCEIGK
jgi:hypothetical protein